MTLIVEPPELISRLPLVGDAVIEASAGTGKTFTIENLVVDRLLRTEITIEEMLVVTFTRKATAELKARIRSKIESLLTRWHDTKHGDAPEVDPTLADTHWIIDDAARRKLEAALFGFDRGAVFTIHGFCNRVLAELAFQTGQLFENELVEAKTVFFRAFREILRRHITTDETTSAVLNEWLEGGKSASALGRLLHRAHSIRLLEDRPDLVALKHDIVTAIVANFDGPCLAAEYARARLTKKARESAEACLAVLAEIPQNSPMNIWCDALDQLDLATLYAPRHTGKRTADTRDFPVDMSPETRGFAASLQQYQSVEQMGQNRAFRVIEAFLPPIQAALEELKLREGLFTYDDVLDRIVDALDGDSGPELLAALRNRYQLALIDEFQDTDRRQWTIFHRVFGESDAHSLCVIGDPKQAIYGFRGAEVYTYLRACETLCERPDAPAVKLALDTCYRSSQSLIDGINLMVGGDGLGDFFHAPIEYASPVKCGRPQYQLTRGTNQIPEPAITLWRLEPPSPSKRKPKVNAKDIGPPLANQLASTLRQMLDDPAHTLYWHDGNETRPIGAGDVMVLVRTKNESAEIGDALRRMGVPFVALESRDVFCSTEALYLRDLLASLGSPGHDGRQMAALVSPFFGVPLSTGYTYAQLSSEHPYATRLQRWRFLAEQGYFGQLFSALLDESGLVARALFGDEDAQSLTNIQHLLELLTEEVAERRLSLEELIELLDERAQDNRGSGAEDAKLRATADGTAVQILTIHKSKGLEAAVVCVYGDFGKSPADPIELIHVDGERRFLVGEAMKKAFASQLEATRQSEAERLHYVAMTRAKVKLFLPFIDTEVPLSGGYQVVNTRLCRLQSAGELPAESFVTENVDARMAPFDESILQSWTPPVQLMTDAAKKPHFGPLYRLRAAHAPLVMTSYTRLKDQGVLRSEHVPLDAEEFKEDPTPMVLPDQEFLVPDRKLPGGRHMGRCLHEIIELIPFGTLPAFEEWRQDTEVENIVGWALKRHGIDPFWRSQCEELVYQTVTRPVMRPGSLELPPFCQMREVRELEFLFPIPEAHHPLLHRGPPSSNALWTVERGYIKGFIDLVFEHEDRVYWADWKSDTLPRYDGPTLENHVQGHYDTQAQIYTLGMVRLLGITDEADYERRFGGLLYVFLRGFAHGDEGEGLYFARPSWSTVCADEQRLEQNIPGWGQR